MMQPASLLPETRLVHLSDIHFGAEDREALEAVEKFCSHVKPDAVIIAGDITQRGRRSEFEAHRAEWEAVARQGDHELANHTAHHRGAVGDERVGEERETRRENP